MSESNENFWKLVDEMYKLNSSYAQRWLTLLVYSRGNQLSGVLIEHIRDFMLIEDTEYKQKSDLIRRVVYDPISEINRETTYHLDYSFLYGKRKPIHGFNFLLYSQQAKSVLSESYGPDHLVTIGKEYLIPTSLLHRAGQHPLAVAALFQSHRNIVKQKVFIERSGHHYMLKVIENSLSYIKPLLRYVI